MLIEKISLEIFKKSVKYPLRKATLLFLRNGDKVLLAMKKRGFGQGRYNGVGGKQHPKETITQTAIREATEEITAQPIAPKRMAILDFYFSVNPDWHQQVHVFATDKWAGEPKESDEMKPKWFKVDALPFKTMWPDDPYWLPRILKDEKIYAEFIIGKGDTILDYKVKKVKVLK